MNPSTKLTYTCSPKRISHTCVTCVGKYMRLILDCQNTGPLNTTTLKLLQRYNVMFVTSNLLQKVTCKDMLTHITASSHFNVTFAKVGMLIALRFFVTPLLAMVRNHPELNKNTSVTHASKCSWGRTPFRTIFRGNMNRPWNTDVRTATLVSIGDQALLITCEANDTPKNACDISIT